MKHLFAIKIRRFLPALLCAFLFALSGALLFSRPVHASADGELTVPEAGGTLPAGTYRLEEDVTVERALTISGPVTIDLNGHVLSLKEGQDGSVIMLLGGSLTLKSDASGGEIRGGNSTTGGGIYVGAALTLCGNVKITDNTGSNVYLSNNNRLTLQAFTGEAGISMGSPGVFTDDEVGSGIFTSDDPSYSAVGRELKIARLKSVLAIFRGEGKVFPTTELESLKKYVEVTGTNVNDAPYIGQIAFTLSPMTSGDLQDGRLSVGQNAIRVTAQGEEQETALGAFYVTAERPLLSSVSVEYENMEPVYFDTPLTALVSAFRVTGEFEDGIKRDLLYVSSPEQYEEDYIDVRFALEGDLAVHPDGNATVAVRCGTVTETVSVPVSKYKLNADDIRVQDVCMEDKSGAWRVEDRDFTPDLPDGIDVTATYAGQPLGSGMQPGEYEVELRFTVTDGENYEPVEEVLKAKFILNRSLYAGGMAEGGEYTYSFTKEGGIDPGWEFEYREAADAVGSRPVQDYEVMQACELTVRKDGIVVTDTGTVRVALLLNGKLRGKTDLKLYRVLSDGTLIELSYTVEGNHILFEAGDFAQTRYLIAANSEFGVYLWITIIFGAACVIGAGVLVWYFVCKRKMKLKN